MGRPKGSKNKVKRESRRLDDQLERRESAEALQGVAQEVRFEPHKPPAQPFDAEVVGLQKLGDKLTDVQKKILAVILTDFADDPEAEPEKYVFNKLKNACARAGMSSSREDQVLFFRTVADPEFQHVVRSVGSGIIGMYIVPIVAKVVQQALEGDKTSQRWALQISGVMPDKYDFYLNRYQLTHNEVNIGELNLDGKTDEELKGILNEISYDAEAEVVSD